MDYLLSFAGTRVDVIFYKNVINNRYPTILKVAVYLLEPRGTSQTQWIMNVLGTLEVKCNKIENNHAHASVGRRKGWRWSFWDNHRFTLIVEWANWLQKLFHCTKVYWYFNPVVATFNLCVLFCLEGNWYWFITCNHAIYLSMPSP